MSSSPTFVMNPTRGEEEEEMLAIDQGRSHTPPPRSRPSSRIEILLMDLVRSQAEMARSQGEMARSQAEQSRSTEEKLENLARSQAEQSRSTEGKFESFARAQSEQLANITGRLSSLEVS